MTYYLHGTLQDWDHRDARARGTHYLLLWDSVLAELSESERSDLELIATSDGTDAKGRLHLVLVKISA